MYWLLRAGSQRLGLDVLLRLIRQAIENRLKFQAGRFELPVIRLTRDPERISVEEQAPGERIRDHVPVPTRKEFFFEQAKAKGTIGRPVALAN
jgi:hypothetical protein